MGPGRRAIIRRIVSDPSTAPTGRVLTGFRPTGPMHVGHWFGNVMNLVRLQDDHEAFYFIADWHMLTTHYDRADELPGYVRMLVLDLLAAGVDPNRVTFYRQSDVKEVAELTLLLGMITPLGWLERVPTYKERLRDHAERDLANYGLLGYPVIQTVDIAIVKGELVPVGEDQVAHLELSREIVRRFNRLYGDVLVEPQPLLSPSPNIPGSDGRKMSKSSTTRSTSATTRTRSGPRCARSSPIRRRSARAIPDVPRSARSSRCTGCSPQDILEWTDEHCRTGELGCVDCKGNLADRIVAYYAPFRERREDLDRTPEVADEVLAAGAAKVGPVVEDTMKAVRSAMHLS